MLHIRLHALSNADPSDSWTQERNVHGMKLVEGEGNAYDSRGKALEGDVFNTVFIVVSIIPSSQCPPFSQISVRSHVL